MEPARLRADKSVSALHPILVERTLGRDHSTVTTGGICPLRAPLPAPFACKPRLGCSPSRSGPAARSIQTSVAGRLDFPGHDENQTRTGLALVPRTRMTVKAAAADLATQMTDRNPPPASRRLRSYFRHGRNRSFRTPAPPARSAGGRPPPRHTFGTDQAPSHAP